MKLKKMYAMLVMLMLFGAVVPAITMARGLGVEGDTIVDAENIDEIDREVDQNIQRKADLDKTTLEDGEDEHPKGEFPDERASKEERIRDVDTPNLIELEGERKKIEKEDITKEKRDVFALPESGSSVISDSSDFSQITSEYKLDEPTHTVEPRGQELTEWPTHKIQEKTDNKYTPETSRKASNHVAAESKSGVIIDETWTEANSPYWIEGDVYALGTFEIQAGVEIYFNGSYAIFVDDTIYVNGTSAKMVNFTSNNTVNPSPADWGALVLNNTVSAVSHIEYANFSYADTALWLDGISPRISNCTFFTNGEGIYASQMHVEYCKFMNNTNGIYSDAITGDTYLHMNDFIRNTNGVYYDFPVILGGNFDWIVEISGNHIYRNTQYGIHMPYAGASVMSRTVFSTEFSMIGNDIIENEIKGLYLYPLSVSQGFECQMYLNLTVEGNTVMDNGYSASAAAGDGLYIATGTQSSVGPAHFVNDWYVYDNTIITNRDDGVQLIPNPNSDGFFTSVDSVINASDNVVLGNGRYGLQVLPFAAGLSGDVLMRTDATLYNNNVSHSTEDGAYVQTQVYPADGGNVTAITNYLFELNEIYSNGGYYGLGAIVYGEQANGYSFNITQNGMIKNNKIFSQPIDGMDIGAYGLQTDGGNSTISMDVNISHNNIRKNDCGIFPYGFNSISDPTALYNNVTFDLYENDILNNPSFGVYFYSDGPSVNLMSYITDCNIMGNFYGVLYDNSAPATSVNMLFDSIISYNGVGLITFGGATLDWYIDDYGEAHFNDIYMFGDVFVEPTGKHSLITLTMICLEVTVDGMQEVINAPNSVVSTNVTINGMQWLNSSAWEIDCAYDGEHHIEVTSTGHMLIQDNGNGSSLVTNYTSNAYEFWVQTGGTLEVYDSIIEYCGWQDFTDDMMHSGLWTKSDSLTIERSWIRNGFNGIVVNNCMPKINNSTIMNNDYSGIYSFNNSYLDLFNDTVVHNGDPAIVNTAGIITIASDLELYSSNVSYNGGGNYGYGIISDTCSVYTQDSFISSNDGVNEGYGIFFVSTNLDVYNTTITNNTYGLYTDTITNEYLNIADNSNISWNDYGVYFDQPLVMGGIAHWQVDITDSWMNNNTLYACYLEYAAAGFASEVMHSVDITMTNNDFNGNGYRGVYIFPVVVSGGFNTTMYQNITFNDNNATSNGYGGGSTGIGDGLYIRTTAQGQVGTADLYNDFEVLRNNISMNRDDGVQMIPESASFGDHTRVDTVINASHNIIQNQGRFGMQVLPFGSASSGPSYMYTDVVYYMNNVSYNHDDGAYIATQFTPVSGGNATAMTNYTFMHNDLYWNGLSSGYYALGSTVYATQDNGYSFDITLDGTVHDNHIVNNINDGLDVGCYGGQTAGGISNIDIMTETWNNRIIDNGVDGMFLYNYISANEPVNITSDAYFDVHDEGEIIGNQDAGIFLYTDGGVVPNLDAEIRDSYLDSNFMGIVLYELGSSNMYADIHDNMVLYSDLDGITIIFGDADIYRNDIMYNGNFGAGGIYWFDLYIDADIYENTINLNIFDGIWFDAVFDITIHDESIYMNEISYNVIGDGIFAASSNGNIELNMTGNNNSIEFNGWNGIELVAGMNIDIELMHYLCNNTWDGLNASATGGYIDAEVYDCNMSGNGNNGMTLFSFTHTVLTTWNMNYNDNWNKGLQTLSGTNLTAQVANCLITENWDTGASFSTMNDHLKLQMTNSVLNNNTEYSAGENLYLYSGDDMFVDIDNSEFNSADFGKGINSWCQNMQMTNLTTVQSVENLEDGINLHSRNDLVVSFLNVHTLDNGEDGVNLTAYYPNGGLVNGVIDTLISSDNLDSGLAIGSYDIGSGTDRLDIIDSTFSWNSNRGISVVPARDARLNGANLHIHNNTEDGIYFTGYYSRIDISDSTLTHNSRGIYVNSDYSAFDVTVSDSSILYQDHEGILIQTDSYTYVDIINNVMRSNSMVSGDTVNITAGGPGCIQPYIDLEMDDNVITWTHNGNGVFAHSFDLFYLDLANNVIEHNLRWGFYATSVDILTVDSDMNTIRWNGDGIHLESFYMLQGWMDDDTVTYNDGNGVEIAGAFDFHITNIVASYNGNNGMELQNCMDTWIDASEFNENDVIGIAMWNGDSIWLESSDIYGNYLGAYLNQSVGVLIGNNTITYNLGSASNGDGGGIWAEDNSDMILMNNEISFNLMYGVYSDDSSEADWYVDSTAEAKSNIILLEGDIEVWNGGDLLLKDISGTYPNGLDLGVFIRSDMNNEHHIIVNSGGNLDVINSHISSYSMDSYEFEVHGDMLLNGATVEMAYRLEIHSNGVDIIGSTVKNGWYGGIAVYGSSPTIERTQIMDNTYYGLYLNNSVPTIDDLEISGNRDGILLDQTSIDFYDLELTDNDNGIKAISSSQFNIYNSTLENTANDFYLQDGSSGWVLNTEFDKTATMILDSSYLDVNWFAHVKVEDHNGNAFSEVPVEIYDSTSALVASGTTDGTGMASWFVLQEYREDSAGMTYSTPHNFTATVMSSTWYTHDTMDETKTVTITGNNMPYITSTAPTTVDEDTEYYYNVDATDPNGDGLTFSLTDRPTGMTIDSNTGEISWMPTDEDVGLHDVAVMVEDGHDGWDTQSWQITVFNTNDAPIITSTPITNAVEDMMYNYNVSAEDDDIDSGDMLSYSLDVAPAGMMIEDTGMISWTPTNSDVGDHTVVVRVTDSGMEYDTQTFVITVQNVNDAPTITSAAPTTAMEDHDYTYDVQADDVDGDELTYSLTDRPTGMTIDSETGMITWTPTNDDVGLNDVTVRVQDGNGGSDTQSWQINVTNVNDAPMITSSAPTTAIEDMEYSYPVGTVDIDGDTLSYSLLVGPEDMDINSAGHITWTPVNADVGDHTVMVEVSDGNNGTDTQTFMITVQNTNDAPTITSEEKTSAEEDSEYVYDVNANDVDGDELYYSLSEKPTGMTIDSSTGMISWIPNNDQVGSHPVSVMVSDGKGGYDNQTWDISVSNVNDMPVITSTPVSSAVEDSAYIYAVKATDIDGDSLTYTLDVAPSGMVIASDGTITWTPTDDHVGTHAVMVSVDDGTEEDVQTFDVTVQNVNDAPSIVSEAVTIASEDTDYVYDVDGEDIDGDELTYSLTEKPTGMEIDSSSGMISWTPTNDQVGDFDVGVKVSDGKGGVDEQSFTLSVGNVNDDPILMGATISPRDGTSDDKYEFSVTYSDADGDQPTGVYVYIDGEQYEMERLSGDDYTKGVVYSYSKKLDDGPHSIYFAAEDVEGGTQVTAVDSVDVEEPESQMMNWLLIILLIILIILVILDIYMWKYKGDEEEEVPEEEEEQERPVLQSKSSDADEDLDDLELEDI